MRKLASIIMLCAVLVIPQTSQATETLADAYLRQALTLVSNGQLERAEEFLDLAKGESSEQNNSARLKKAAILNNLGDVQRRIATVYRQSQKKAHEQGDLEAEDSFSLRSSDYLSRAIQNLESSIRMKEEILGPDNLNSLRSLENLAAAYEESDEWLKAESIYRKVLQVRGQALGREHPDNANALFNLGEICAKNGRLPEAEQNFYKASRMWSQQHGAQSVPVARCLREIGECKFQHKDFKNAKSLAQRAKTIFIQKAGKDNEEVRQCDSLLMNIP